MKKILCVSPLLLLLTNISFSAMTGIFDNQSEIGKPKLSGSSTYNAEDQSYKLSGAGYNIWFARDEFHYLYKELDGDFILTANFELLGKGVTAHRKVGWMVRKSTDEDEPHFSAALHGDGLTVGQFRDKKGTEMDHNVQLQSTKSHYQILQIERSGNTYIFRAAKEGEILEEVGSHEMNILSGKVLVGLFVCSHNPDVAESAKVWNVRIDRPVPDDYNAGKQGTLSCRMETMDVFTGERRVIWENKEKFEAPNWMPNKKKLLFNKGGHLYTIPVKGGEPTLLNTGSVVGINNDHGISFDGKTIAISARKQDPVKGNGSAVYVVPLKGGEPKLITKDVPSYWHGWSPNNKDVVYVAKRDSSHPYNIFQADIHTTKETQLTFFKDNHVDGPEYGPDGKWIYYNGSQTGPMQIWRMRPNGSGQEQLTFDKYNDWFPHISPDGKWMVYITFPTTIRKDSHPSYKRVMLRLMSLETMESRVIAYLYGGQGTINVPSWSPDSRHIAFVSNAD